MESPDSKAPLALIVGPTASGKSALALELAKRQDAVIVNADSAQVYQDLQVLSARPDQAEMAGVPHRLYGYIDGARACTAARWAADAKREIASAQHNGQLPILVGGTGLYVRTLLDGISPIPEIDGAIRAEIRALPVADAFAALAEEDPASAQRLNANDTSRIMRALEVVRSTGHPLAHWQARTEGGIGDAADLHPLVLLPPREWLYERCDRRFDVMMANGAVAEVEALLARGLDPDLPVMRAIGVREIAAMIDGHQSREEAISAAKAATRQYAKRQYTWFRNQLPASWPRWQGDINDNNASDIVSLFHF